MGFYGFYIFIRADDDLATIAAKVERALDLPLVREETSDGPQFVFKGAYENGLLSENLPGVHSFYYQAEPYGARLELKENDTFMAKYDPKYPGKWGYYRYQIRFRVWTGGSPGQQVTTLEVLRWGFQKLKAMGVPLLVCNQEDEPWADYDPLGDIPKDKPHVIPSYLPESYSVLIQSEEPLATVAEKLGATWGVNFQALTPEQHPTVRFAFSWQLPGGPFERYAPGVDSFVDDPGGYSLSLLIQPNQMKAKNDVFKSPEIETYQHEVIIYVKSPGPNLSEVATADYTVWAWERLKAANLYRAGIYARTGEEYLVAHKFSQFAPTAP
jgi:hypothetical protein